MKRNLQINSVKVEESAYKGLVRPILEYSSSVWDPYHKKYIEQLEMVQRRAARYALGRYHNTSSVTDMLKELQWETLEERRRKARLTMFYKILLCIVAIPLPVVVVQKPRPRPGYPHQFMIPYCRTEAYKNSFFPNTISHWNKLPPSTASQTSLSLFQADLKKLSF